VGSVCVRARKCAFSGCDVYEKFKEYRESVHKTGGLKPVFWACTESAGKKPVLAQQLENQQVWISDKKVSGCN